MEKILTFQMLKWKLVAEALDYTVTTKLFNLDGMIKMDFLMTLILFNNFVPYLFTKKPLLTRHLLYY